jgi:hypothetical protein
MLIQLEVVSDEEQPAEIADVDEVRRGLVDQLTQGGHTIKPTSTGVRSGGLLYDILLPIPQILHNNKDWLLPAIAPVLQCLVIACNSRAQQEKAKRSPLKITVEVSGKPVVIEAKDPKDVVKLLEQLQIVQNDKVKIKVRVPKKKRHR